MNFESFDCESIPASVDISRFEGQSGVNEYHLMIHPTQYGSFETQLECVFNAYRNALDSAGLDMHTAIVRRFFCNDLTNQAVWLENCPFSDPHNTDEPCAVSWVGQPPAPPSKVALWAYHISDPGCKLNKIHTDSSLTLTRGELAHYWTTGITCLSAETSYDQTQGIFEKYDDFLKAQKLSLADNVIRTWLFVQDIDVNYHGLVAARREFFARHGLTKDTHFIASTGVEGTHADVAAKVTMDAHAISGMRHEQIKFLTAPDHLSPTHIYGVTFERGTSIAYRDRKHILISGTASIDHDGKILHPGDVSRQLDRTIENIEALLKTAGATLNDMCMLITYVRDHGDQVLVYRQMRQRFGDVPLEVVVAPVCRPGWLVEVEGKAVIPASNPQLPPF
jgi:enamine deaminase RidA (YjgF/YER057c/UK114 family)